MLYLNDKRLEEMGAVLGREFPAPYLDELQDVLRFAGKTIGSFANLATDVGMAEQDVTHLRACARVLGVFADHIEAGEKRSRDGDVDVEIETEEP